MKQIVIISGKGGTGKTVLTAAWAVAASNAVLADCDVDASNLHLLLAPRERERHAFSGGLKPRIDEGRCTRCGLCAEACRFEAVVADADGGFHIDPVSCEACRVCHHLCPAGAVVLEAAETGEWYVSDTDFGPFVHARLRAGEENSGKLVTAVRTRAREMAAAEERGLVLIDGPPGIGCPVIASLSGTDLAVIVTEPTPSGIHDMGRVIGVARHFGVRAACVVNRADIHAGNAAAIEAWCGREGVTALGRVPYDEAVPRALRRGRPLPLDDPGTPAAVAAREVWDRLRRLITNKEGA